LADIKGSRIENESVIKQSMIYTFYILIYRFRLKESAKQIFSSFEDLQSLKAVDKKYDKIIGKM
jgi:hypothetical protein